MILSDRDIKARRLQGDIVIQSPNNYHLANVHASSLDLRIGRFFKIYDHTKYAIMDPLQPDTFKDIARLIEVDEERVPFIVQPGEFVLGVTMEKIKILGIVGSLRKDSYNKSLLRTAGEMMPENVEFEMADISALPLYNNDLLENMPEVARELKAKIKGAVRTFTLYMRYPESEYPRIQVAERLDDEGNAVFAELQREFTERYFQGEAVSVHA